LDYSVGEAIGEQMAKRSKAITQKYQQKRVLMLWVRRMDGTILITGVRGVVNTILDATQIRKCITKSLKNNDMSQSATFEIKAVQDKGFIFTKPNGNQFVANGPLKAVDTFNKMILATETIDAMKTNQKYKVTITIEEVVG
jgi:hypothetical protein